MFNAFGCTVIDDQDGIYNRIGANTLLFAPFLPYFAYMTSAGIFSIAGRPTDNLAVFIANDIK